jgi:hypothetical protein
MAIDLQKYKSCMNVKLSFKKDVAPRNYSGIRERLEIPRVTFSGFIDSTYLSDYLKIEEGLEINKPYETYDSFSKGRKVSINSNRRKMTLEVSVESEKKLGPDELLNAVNLYNFILTGNYPLRGKEKLKEAYIELERRESK